MLNFTLYFAAKENTKCKIHQTLTLDCFLNAYLRHCVTHAHIFVYQIINFDTDEISRELVESMH